MCGIVGVFSFAGPRVGERDIEAMCDRLVHRGPDGAGVWLSQDGRVGLGHRRLSIIDLSSLASQPMANHDGSIQVVFNGDIYNHAEVRREIDAVAPPACPPDPSDTEAATHA